MKKLFEPLKPAPNALGAEETEISDATGAIADEPVIELTNILEEAGSKIESPEDESEVIIDLTDIVREETPPPPLMVEEFEDRPAAEGDFAAALGMELEESSRSSSVAPNQVEEAIERVVREMLSKKIDGLLMKVIEREVSRELERIRKLLLEELPDSDHL